MASLVSPLRRRNLRRSAGMLAPAFPKRMVHLDGDSGAAIIARAILPAQYENYILDESRRLLALQPTWNALRPMHSERQSRLERRLDQIERRLSKDPSED